LSAQRKEPSKSYTHGDTPARANVNVTGEDWEFFTGKMFPCPVCGVGLEIRPSRRRKPYCVCLSCGIQVFVRGKTGIERLRNILENEQWVSAKSSGFGSAVVIFNRLQQLRAEKAELEGKQGLIFRDEDLDNAIRIVDREIQHVQGVLSQMAQQNGGRKRR
jgi:hypothetical protein